MHPAVTKVLNRIHGVEWHYQLFDYGLYFEICGERGEKSALHSKG